MNLNTSLKRTVKLLSLSCFSLFVITLSFIYLDGITDELPQNKTITVILGSKVNEDGTLSDRLKARLDKGIALYQDSLVSTLYVSGGLGKEGFYEGDVMASYLLSKGIPPKNIIIDNLGINTRHSSVNFRKDIPNEDSVILVSQFFHITRAKLAFRQEGVNNVYGVHCSFFEWRDFYSLSREFLGLYYYLLTDLARV